MIRSTVVFCIVVLLIVTLFSVTVVATDARSRISDEKSMKQQQQQTAQGVTTDGYEIYNRLLQDISDSPSSSSTITAGSDKPTSSGTSSGSDSSLTYPTMVRTYSPTITSKPSISMVPTVEGFGYPKGACFLCNNDREMGFDRTLVESLKVYEWILPCSLIEPTALNGYYSEEECKQIQIAIEKTGGCTCIKKIKETDREVSVAPVMAPVMDPTGANSSESSAWMLMISSTRSMFGYAIQIIILLTVTRFAVYYC